MGPATGSEPQHRPDRDDTYRGAARPSINDSSQVQPCGTRDFLKKRVFFQQSPQHGRLRHQKDHVAQLSAIVRMDGRTIETTELHRCPSSLTGTYLRETKGLTTESKPPEHETESKLGPATRPEPPAPKIDPDHRAPHSSEFRHPTDRPGRHNHQATRVMTTAALLPDNTARIKTTPTGEQRDHP